MEFPTLSTGAVAQYPTVVQVRQDVEILKFVDGSEQRFLRRGRAKRAWTINLARLSESELASVHAFFDRVRGSMENFTFRDPWSGTEHHNCRLKGDVLAARWTGADGNETQLIVETEG